MREKIVEIKKIFNINVIYWINSIIVIFGICSKIDVKENLIEFTGNKVIYLLALVFVFYLYKKANMYQGKRKKVFSIALSVLISGFQTVGIMTKDNWICNEVIVSKKIILYIVLIFLAYVLLFYPIIKLLMSFLEDREKKNENNYILKPTIKNCFIVAGVFFILWLPYFLNYYPGITSFDTNYQLLQGLLPSVNLTNHHPIFHTLIITLITKIGYYFTHNYNFCIALCSILQMIACAFTFAYVVIYMNKRKANKWLIICTLLFFGLCPFVPQFSIAIWKDVPFTLCMTIFIVLIAEMIDKKTVFFESKKNVVVLIIISLLIMLFRNNGIYMLVLSLPFIFWFNRKNWKKVVIIFGLPIVIYKTLTGPIFSHYNIQKSSSREMLSIPIQQMARIVKYRLDELSDDEKMMINEFIPVDKAGDLYNPTISDPVKNEFFEENYKNNKMQFFKLYGKLALKYPGETIEAFIGNTYGYYYPDVVTYAIATGNYQSPFEAEQFLDIHSAPIVKIKGINWIIKSIYDKKVPIVSWIANIGLCFWFFISLMSYCLYKKKYRALLVYIPLLALYLTCLASPVSGELRYVYYLYTCMPIVIVCTLGQEKNDVQYEEKK